MTAEGRNVLFVVLDTVRKDRLSAYGYDRDTSPRLDAFADEAAVFEEAVAPAPWTLPVHASLFTGQYPSQHGATQERPYLHGTTTLAETLSAAGYASACFSSNAWITPYTGLTDGFDEHDNFFEVLPADLLSGPLARAWRAVNDRAALRAVADRLVAMGNAVHERLAAGERADSKTPAVVDRTIDFIEGRDRFFAFINLMDAHLPYRPPEAYRERFAPGADPASVCQNSKEYNSGARAIDDDEWADIRGLYDAEIAHLDAELGRLFDWLRSADLWEETLVVVCADHGELHGEHDLYGHEFCLYDPLVNVPLLVSSPEVDPGVRTEQVELLDLYHTVLDAAAVDPAPGGLPPEPDRSLLSPSYRGGDGADYAYIEYARPVIELNQLESKASRAGVTIDEQSRFYSRMRAVRRPDGKYIRNERVPDEFYRLDLDPGEADDRRSAGDEVEADLAAALAGFEADIGAPWGEEAADVGAVVAGMDGEARARLRDLGYLE